MVKEIRWERNYHPGRKSGPYLNWKIKVLRRDKCTCQVCGTQNDIHVHHICNYSDHPQFATQETNGICLCEKCHRVIHKYYEAIERIE